MKKAYCTEIALQVKWGILDEEQRKRIPKSTQYYWGKKNFSNFVGYESMFTDEKMQLVKNFLSNKTLLNAAKGLFFVFSTWTSMTSNMRGLKTLVRKNMESIVKTIDLVIPLMGLKHVCKLFKISQNQYYAWKRRVVCGLSPLNECVKRNSLSISPSEVKVIEQFVQDEQYKDYPLVTVFYKMIRQEKAFMSLTTFYKYAKLFGNSVVRKLFKPKQKTGIRAAKPKEIIHADVCVYRPLDHTKCFIYFIVDNFSRMILGWKISIEYKSSIMLDNLRNVYVTYLLEKEDPVAVLMVDDGIENKGHVSTAIENREIKLNKLIAQKDIHFSNSTIEAVNKIMKYNFLFRQDLYDFKHVQRFLETAVEDYNNRPHSALFGLTPYEVFHGRAPDKTLFKSQMEHAKIIRKAENRSLSCDNCAFTLENQAEKRM